MDTFLFVLLLLIWIGTVGYTVNECPEVLLALGIMVVIVLCLIT